MTEEDWLLCTEPFSMLNYLQYGVIVLVDELPTQAARDAIRTFLQSAVTRKLRLFGCWCCRRIWDELVDGRSRKAVEVTEYFVDGLATEEQLRAANLNAINARNAIRGNHIRRIAADAVYAASGFEVEGAAAGSADVVNWVEEVPHGKDARAEQAPILRCIFGNPFRPAALDPNWRTTTVLALAQGIYDDRAFDRLPILADALQDAGCDNEEMLAHCRGLGPHARGCWVVDLVLEKT